MPGDQVSLEDLAVMENFACCLKIVVIFIGLGRAHRLGGGRDFEAIIWGGKPQRDKITFMGEVDPSRQHVKILIWQLEEG